MGKCFQVGKCVWGWGGELQEALGGGNQWEPGCPLGVSMLTPLIPLSASQGPGPLQGTTSLSVAPGCQTRLCALVQRSPSRPHLLPALPPPQPSHTRPPGLRTRSGAIPLGAGPPGRPRWWLLEASGWQEEAPRAGALRRRGKGGAGRVHPSSQPEGESRGAFVPCQSGVTTWCATSLSPPGTKDQPRSARALGAGDSWGIPPALPPRCPLLGMGPPRTEAHASFSCAPTVLRGTLAPLLRRLSQDPRSRDLPTVLALPTVQGGPRVMHLGSHTQAQT